MQNAELWRIEPMLWRLHIKLEMLNDAVGIIKCRHIKLWMIKKFWGF